LLKELQPKPEFVALFREVVLEVLKTRQADALQIQAGLERKLRELRGNRERLEQAYVYERAIDADAFNRMKTALDLAREKRIPWLSD
jgi:hypothetical protein